MDRQSFYVVLIEDDPMVQEVNRQFVEQVDGFKVVGLARDGLEGLRLVKQLRPDLVLLDLYMPAQDGMETLLRLRNEAFPVDVVVITAADDVSTIRNIIRHGVIDYIIKPFKFERVKDTLEKYRQFRTTLPEESHVTQSELDEIWHGKHLHQAGRPVHSIEKESDIDLHKLPKGLNAGTMKQILHYLQRENRLLSAEEVADGVGIARVTARRYLEYLEKTEKVRLDIRYGGVGRPVNRYALANNQNEQK